MREILPPMQEEAAEGTVDVVTRVEAVTMRAPLIRHQLNTRSHLLQLFITILLLRQQLEPPLLRLSIRLTASSLK